MSEKTADLFRGVLGTVKDGTGAEPPQSLPALAGRVQQLTEDMAELVEKLGSAIAESRELRAELSRLDADLDESRRLNLRAAELLDIVYTQLTGEMDFRPRPDAGSPGGGT